MMDHARVTTFALAGIRAALWVLLFPAILTASPVTSPTEDSNPVASEQAESSAIVTDRPDLVESSETVGWRHFQIETSVAINRDRKSRFSEASPPTLLRYGLGELWEARLETDGIVHSLDGAQKTALADIAVGVKRHLFDSLSKAAPAVAVLIHVDMPSETGAPGRGVRPSLRFVGEWELSSRK